MTALPRPQTSPYPGNGSYVPMSLYLSDREETRSALREIANEVRGLRRDLDRDDAAENAVEKTRAWRWPTTVAFLSGVGLVAITRVFEVIIR